LPPWVTTIPQNIKEESAFAVQKLSLSTKASAFNAGKHSKEFINISWNKAITSKWFKLSN
jgi:hypothetical protein